MTINDAIVHALDGNAILFAGSGFSFGAKTTKGNPFKIGSALRDYIAEQCGMKGSTTALDVISQYYNKKNGSASLIELLKEEFALSEIRPYHKEVMSVPWKRIYTTNYDRVIEEAAKQNGYSLTPITLSDNIEDYDKKNICVHINGYIDRLNNNTLDKEFKLTDRSYACEALDGNEWYEFMKNDFASAKAIIIVGYSMQFDIDIKRLIALPNISKKTIFIIGGNPNEADISLLKEYAECEVFGTDGLATLISDIKTTYVPSVGREMTSFIKEYMQPLIPGNVAFDDIINAFVLGKITDKLFQKNAFGDYEFMLYRDALKILLRNIKNKRVFIISSGLGNGKTVFLKLLRNELRSFDMEIYVYNKDSVDLDNEIEHISSLKKRVVVIIENYYSHLDIIRRFNQLGVENITFVFTARTSINNSYIRKLQNILKLQPDEVQSFYIDRLKDNEISGFAEILKKNNIFSDKFKNADLPSIEQYLNENCSCRLSDILLDMFKSSDIKDRIEKVVSELGKRTSEVRELYIMTLLQTSMNIELYDYDLMDLFKIDYSLLTSEDNEFVHEVLDFASGQPTIKSSIIANHILHELIGIDEIIDSLIHLYKEADKRRTINKRYEELQKNIISHSHFVNYKPCDENFSHILRFYDTLRNESFSVNNPFYWEQFALACIDMKKFVTARQCLENALSIAKGIDDFVPYQIETVYGRYLTESLLFEAVSKEQEPDDVVHILMDIHNRVTKHYNHPFNNYVYVFKVASRYPELYSIIQNRANDRHKSIFIEKIGDMCKKMDQYIEKSGSSYDVDYIMKWKSELVNCREKCKQ